MYFFPTDLKRFQHIIQRAQSLKVNVMKLPRQCVCWEETLRMESKARIPCSAAYQVCHPGQAEPQCIICEMGMITYVDLCKDDL